MLMLLIAGALLVTGCGAEPGQTGAGSTSEPTETPTSPGSPASGVPSPTASQPLPTPSATGSQVQVPATLLEQIRADAAQRAGVTPDAVQVVSSTAQTWNDGSLGCPKPGENYIQVMIDGFQVIVQAGGRTYDYRTSQTGIKLCEK